MNNKKRLLKSTNSLNKTEIKLKSRLVKIVIMNLKHSIIASNIFGWLYYLGINFYE